MIDEDDEFLSESKIYALGRKIAADLAKYPLVHIVALTGPHDESIGISIYLDRDKAISHARGLILNYSGCSWIKYRDVEIVVREFNRRADKKPDEDGDFDDISVGCSEFRIHVKSKRLIGNLRMEVE